MWTNWPRNNTRTSTSIHPWGTLIILRAKKYRSLSLGRDTPWTGTPPYELDNKRYLSEANYLTTKHNWSEKTWRLIDPRLVKAYHNHKTILARNMWFKVAHNLHTLERENKRCIPTHVPISISTLAHAVRDNLRPKLHTFTCESNPNRNAALVELTTGGSDIQGVSPFRKGDDRDCIEQWLYNPNVTPSATDAACPNTINIQAPSPPLYHNPRWRQGRVLSTCRREVLHVVNLYNLFFLLCVQHSNSCLPLFHS
jgi:hypothetical protein